MFFDAHLHLISKEEIVVATKAEVLYFVCNATSPQDWGEVLSVSEQFSGFFPCIGIHPWFIDKTQKGWQNKMYDILSKNSNIMIGEIGLDITRPDFEKQERVFADCLKIASDLKRPVHIHGHKSWNYIVKHLKQVPDVKCLLHRFSGNAVQAKQLLNFNVYFSVMSSRVLSFLPPEKVLVESDAPDNGRSPVQIPRLVADLGLDITMLNNNFFRFIGNIRPFVLPEKGIK